VADEIEKLIKTQYPRAKFGSVGVSVPGLIDRETGSLEISPNLEWQKVPI
jgi:predicted NBD/HSP70 family sugar kinase